MDRDSRLEFPAVDGLIYGADYNPEQWDRSMWEQDFRLMQEAGVNLVSLGIFSWALLEPQPDQFEFAWLDDVMDGLADAGIGVNLANATASPPAWLSVRHPETRPVTREGHRLSPGGRQAYCPSSPIFRSAAALLTETIGQRYAEHPALKMWHVSNELGAHNALCYCDVSAADFRGWLQERYTTIDALNHAWGTAFWSQRYHDWGEIAPPRIAPANPNPTQELDFRRFSDWACREVYHNEADILRRITPDIPVTTNLMLHAYFEDLDYWHWVDHLDLVTNDHYLDSADPEPHIELAFSADLTRGLAGGQPWLLMEHSTSAINWQATNTAKAPGQMIRNSLAHVARGSDGAMFFQWRASVAGAEKYHSAMVPHAGTDTEVWRSVVTLGDTLRKLSNVRGSTVTAQVAMIFDWSSWWSSEQHSKPTQQLRYRAEALAWYREFWNRGITVDFVQPGADLDEYAVVIAPTFHVVDDVAKSALESFCAKGGHALVTFFSGIVDENDHIYLGGYPGAFRDMLGISVEEFHPLHEGEHITLSDSSQASMWTENLHLRGAEAITSYTSGPLTGVAAVTRHQYQSGTAWYAATALDAEGRGRVVELLAAQAEVSIHATPPGVEVVVRSRDDRSYLFVINHTEELATLEATGIDLVSGQEVGPFVEVAPAAVRVIAQT